MDQIPQGSTPTIKAACGSIRHSGASLRDLACRSGVNPKIITRWRRRFPRRRVAGRKVPRSTILFAKPGGIVVAFCCHTRLPLDDCSQPYRSAALARPSKNLQRRSDSCPSRDRRHVAADRLSWPPTRLSLTEAPPVQVHTTSHDATRQADPTMGCLTAPPSHRPGKPEPGSGYYDGHRDPADREGFVWQTPS